MDHHRITRLRDWPTHFLPTTYPRALSRHGRTDLHTASHKVTAIWRPRSRLPRESRDARSRYAEVVAAAPIAGTPTSITTGWNVGSAAGSRTTSASGTPTASGRAPGRTSSSSTRPRRGGRRAAGPPGSGSSLMRAPLTRSRAGRTPVVPESPTRPQHSNSPYSHHPSTRVPRARPARRAPRYAGPRMNPRASNLTAISPRKPSRLNPRCDADIRRRAIDVRKVIWSIPPGQRIVPPRREQQARES